MNDNRNYTPAGQPVTQPLYNGQPVYTAPQNPAPVQNPTPVYTYCLLYTSPSPRD